MNSFQLPKIDKIFCPICNSLECKIKSHQERELSFENLHFYFCHNCNVRFASYDPVYDCPGCSSDNQVVMIL